VSEPTPPSDPSSGGARLKTTSRGWRFLRLAVQLVLTLVVTIFIVDRLGPGMGQLAESAPAAVAIHWGWIGVSSLVLLGGYFFSAWIWSRMVRDLGGPTLPARDSIRIYMVANLGRYIPGKLWQIAGLAVLARSRGVPAPIATAAAVVGQVVALAGTMLVGLVALGSAGPDLARWAPLAIAATAGVAIVVTVPTIFRPLLRFCLRFVPGEKPDEIPIGASEGIRWLALYTVNWVVYAAAFALFVHGLSLPGSLLDVGPAFAASYVMGYIVLIAPAGVGVREGFMVAFLSPIMGPAGATLAAITSRIWMTLVEVVPAGAFWLAGVGRRGVGKEKVA
jgi:glycosyltransferase 2 family protein